MDKNNLKHNDAPDYSRYYNEDFHDTSPRAYQLKTDDVEGAGCFIAGTKIFTSLGWKPIEKLKPGAIVVSYDKDGNIEHGYVRQVHVHKKEDQKDGLIRFTLSDDTVLTVTANHGMWQDDDETPFVEARELRIGDNLYDMHGSALEIVGRKTESLASQDEDFCSYNLTVSPQHTYIAEGIRVHNGGGDKSGQARTPVESPNTLRSKTTAKIQEIISEGEIEGLIDDGQSVYFDGTPVVNADDSPNFEDVAFYFFDGFPDQDPMPGFDAAEAEIVVNVEMLPPPNAGVIRTISGGTDAARITIQLAGGLYHTNTETGDIGGTSVQFRIDTRLSGGVWEEQMTQTITGKTMSTYEASYRVDAPQPYDGVATWEVRCARLSPIDAKVTTKSVTFFARVTEIQEIAIAYENVAVAGVTVDAKSTGGNIPVRSYDVKGIKVQIPTNYDPITRIYTGSWSGQFKTEWTDNPAWITYDLLVSNRYGLGDHLEESTIDRYSFYDASQYNDELVDDGDGGTEPRFTFNTQLSVQTDSWKLIQNVASSMRATVLPGTIITLLQDRPSDTVKLITNANVLEGIFNYTGTALATRKTVAHVTFSDPFDRFLPRTVTEEDTTGISRYGFNPLEFAAFGCTSEGQARRLARWTLDTELNTAEVVVFTVALDNADLIPGDIIKVMDRDYAGLELAGRVAGGTTTIIDLDRDVVLEPGESYTFSVMDADNQAISERTVTTGAGTVSQITLATPLLDTGVALTNQMWTLESDIGVVAREFRVLFMRETEKGKFEISASQYDAGKYARVETGITLPPLVYSDLSDAATVPEIDPPTYEVQAYVDPTFGSQVKLIVKWDHDTTFSHKFKIQYRRDDGNFTDPIYRQEKEFEIDNILPGTIETMISAINTRGVSSVPYISDFTYAPGVNNTMNPPINLIITPASQDTSTTTFASADCSFRWENNPANDIIGGQGVFGGIAGYRVIIEDNALNELEVREVDNVANNDPYFVQTFNFADNVASTGGPHRELVVKVYTRTADGAISTTANTKTFNNPFPPAPGLGLQDNPQGAFAIVTPTGSAKDVAGTVICIRDTAGDFLPVIGDIVYQGQDTAMQIPFPTPLSARSVKAAVFDTFSFDFDDLVFSSLERQEPSAYGIASVTTLPTLPTPLYPDGVVVFLTTDKKLYRVTLNGTVWSAAVDGADIEAGTVTANAILAGTITAANIETGTLTSASGVFGTASIDGADIGTLTVDTINVNNGAITNIAQHEVGSIWSPTNFAGTTNGAFPPTNIPVKNYVTIATVPITIDSTASDIIISANFDVLVQAGSTATSGSEFCGVKISRNGIRIWEGFYDIGQDASRWEKPWARSTGSAVTIDGGIVGSYTYTIDIFGMTQGGGFNTTYEYYQNTLVVTEVKK